MNSLTLGGVLGGLIGLPVLIAYWIGVVALRKSGSRPAWWCMLIGVSFSTLGMISSVGFGVWMSFNMAGTTGFSDYFIWFTVLSGLSGLGSLLFAIGFVLHALKLRRRGDRARELEAIVEAQNEQLSRQGT